ncbi:putative pyrroloquinoline-quinone binding quinoprotein [Saccharothrix saharensis]|uniref:Putative pyrroloquinoline-quinone binding quinoprotein n=1 Tax=Saccharothrix saharensis TaxID=571190 RepID=A0A543JR69_9PSEU|nr:PQQ-binding-like beta-propeller repeat protein [Saccharothrix saharensis]TQM85255.1 putative pyrroloquinoline-quinone binding quinoprotein [Saccharothrix saharensis]
MPVDPDGAGSYEVADGVIAMVDGTGGTATVRRVDPASGEDLWSVPLPDVAVPAEVEVGQGGSLVSVSSTSAPATVILDAADGRVVWRGAVKGVGSGVRTLGDLVLLDVGEGTAAIDVPAGAIRWQTQAFVEVFDTRLIVDDSKSFGLLDPATGHPSRTVPRELFSDAHVFGDTFVVTSDLDGPEDSVSAYDLATGALLWQTPLEHLGRAEVTSVDDGTVLVDGGDSAGNGMYVLALSTGKVNWEAEGDGTAIRVDGQPHVLNERGDRLDVRRGVTGELVGSMPSPGERTPRVVGGALYYDEEGKVLAVRLPELVGQWEVALTDRVGAIRTVVPRGFVVEYPTAGSGGELVGYVD